MCDELVWKTGNSDVTVITLWELGLKNESRIITNPEV